MFRFESAQGMAQMHPDTFEVASIDRLREIVKPGLFVKVCIYDEEGHGERIWTRVVEVDDVKVKATFANQPFSLDADHGDELEFTLQHVYNVANDDGEIA